MRALVFRYRFKTRVQYTHQTHPTFHRRQSNTTNIFNQLVSPPTTVNIQTSTIEQQPNTSLTMSSLYTQSDMSSNEKLPAYEETTEGYETPVVTEKGHAASQEKKSSKFSAIRSYLAGSHRIQHCIHPDQSQILTHRIGDVHSHHLMALQAASNSYPSQKREQKTPSTDKRSFVKAYLRGDAHSHHFRALGARATSSATQRKQSASSTGSTSSDSSSSSFVSEQKRNQKTVAPRLPSYSTTITTALGGVPRRLH